MQIQTSEPEIAVPEAEMTSNTPTDSSTNSSSSPDEEAMVDVNKKRSVLSNGNSTSNKNTGNPSSLAEKTQMNMPCCLVKVCLAPRI